MDAVVPEKTKTINTGRRLGLAIAVIIFTAMGVLIITATGAVRNSVENSYRELAGIIVKERANEITNWLDIYLNDLKVYTESDTVKSGDAQAVIGWLHAHPDLRNPDYDYIFFCGPDGTTYRDTGLVGAPGAICDRDYFRAVFNEGKETFIGNMILSKTSNQYVVPVTRAAKDADGNIFGMFVGMLGVRLLQTEIQSTSVGGQGFFMLTDRDGTIIAHKDEALLLRNTQDFPDLNTLTRLVGGGFSRMNIDGEDLHAFAAPVHNADWSAVLLVPDGQIRQPVVRARMIIVGFAIAIEILIYLFFVLAVNSILRRLNKITVLIDGLSTGDADLTVQLPVKVRDETGALIASVNRFIAKFRAIIRSVKESQDNLELVGRAIASEVKSTMDTAGEMTGSTEQVNAQVRQQSKSLESSSAAITEISSNIASLNRMIEKQADSVSQASSAVEEMIGNIKSVDASVVKMSQEFSGLQADTETGIGKTRSVNTLVQQIAQQSSSMLEANRTIQNIAGQTNLLAMNAAIEAAHAGDAGKGFSVVADEIRKLAESSAAEAKKIGRELDSIQKGITQIVQESEQSETAAHSVSGRISSTGELVAQIRQAMAEQNTGSRQILDALRVMNDSTEEVRGSADEMTKGGEEILRESGALQESMEGIESAVEKMNGGTGSINATASRLKETAETLAESIGNIGKQIGLFKV